MRQGVRPCAVSQCKECYYRTHKQQPPRAMKQHGTAHGYCCQQGSVCGAFHCLWRNLTLGHSAAESLAPFPVNAVPVVIVFVPEVGCNLRQSCEQHALQRDNCVERSEQQGACRAAKYTGQAHRQRSQTHCFNPLLHPAVLFMRRLSPCAL